MAKVLSAIFYDQSKKKQLISSFFYEPNTIEHL